MTAKEWLLKKLLKDLDTAYQEGSVSLAYVKRVIERYGINVKVSASPSKFRSDRNNPVLIYKQLLTLTTSDGKFIPATSSICKIVGLSDGSFLIASGRPIKWCGGIRPSGYVKQIEAVRYDGSLWPGESFVHDFKSKTKAFINYIDSKTYQVASERDLKLHKKFKYRSEYDGTEAEKR